ncbi:P-type DNA transfer ATPase VirB11 [Sphingomonas carotinifaciens]|uniref:Type IV secretion system protein n=1 Tax=Sphingomonas carotinifaciens TaxID=1166323 RepID=A0A1G7M0Z9_9SPHN|nr:P-type DNA transfer ATPase VirB11 [Sphingomonas carotinifaciens]MBB4086958.1 type IV secretion system protein VirB11 [Sphingomonas carotinifaciens]MWC42152.1 P-type DNA transfer ATPase VirB11 [Sphingomonas carotinifaciens]SDF55475.1 type IV secretion system protein VirB11 [Sphingomonas carotinifaciens]
MNQAAQHRIHQQPIVAEVLPLRSTTDVYLSAYLAPFAAWLGDKSVSEILVNGPGEVWVEADGIMRRQTVPAIDDRLIRRLAEQVARVSHQGINRERPLLAATLPDGTRVQFAGPPATRGHWAMAMRRHRLIETTLDAYARAPGASVLAMIEPDPQTDPIEFLRFCVQARRTVLISGGTSSGKTTFLNALLREVPVGERVVVVEDTPEIRLGGGNAVGLLGVKGETGEAKVTTDDLLQASLRLRPDRIVLGELRGGEAVSFLRAINTGHPGSFSTIHANSPSGALDQLALMVMQAGLGLSRTDTLAYARSVIDVVVQLDRQGGRRGIAAVARAQDL